MTPVLATSTLGTVCRKWQQNWAAACGAGLIFILASGLAIGWEAAAGRLTAAGTGPEASGAEPILSAPGVAASRPAVFYDDDDGTACNRPPCRRIRRWLPTATSFRAPDLPSSAAPNELRLFGR